MPPLLLIDGNNLGHALGYLDRAAGHYDQAGLLACLERVAEHLAAQGQPVDIVLFLDDRWAAERLGGWRVQVAPVPAGNADAAILAYVQAHADRPKILVSGDRPLCGDASLWGAVPLPPETFIAHYVQPARQRPPRPRARQEPTLNTWLDRPAPPVQPSRSFAGQEERARQRAALARTEAILRGQPLPAPDVYRLNLDRWADEADLALYLATHHLCPAHPDLTTPVEMIAAIRAHCRRHPRYFTSGPIIQRVFRLFLCRPEHTLSLDDLARLSHTHRRRKIRAAIQKHGGRLGIEAVW